MFDKGCPISPLLSSFVVDEVIGMLYEDSRVQCGCLGGGEKLCEFIIVLC